MPEVVTVQFSSSIFKSLSELTKPLNKNTAQICAVFLFMTTDGAQIVPFLLFIIFTEEITDLTFNDLHQSGTCLKACPCNMRCDDQAVTVFDPF